MHNKFRTQQILNWNISSWIWMRQAWPLRQLIPNIWLIFDIPLNGNWNNTLGSNNWTPTNITWNAASRLYNSTHATFNGSTSSVNFSDNAIFDFGATSDFTISFTCMSTSATNYKPICNQRVWIFGAQFNVAQVPNWGTANSMQIFIYNGSVWISCLSTAWSHSHNVREHWVFTRSNNGTVLRVYKNWILNNTASWLTARSWDNTGIFYIGRDTQNSWRTWHILWFRIYNRVLTDYEIAILNLESITKIH